MLDDGIAHIHLTSFSEGTYDELLVALDEMEAKGMKGLVVDVRQNPGGRLDIAIKISDLFLENGKNIFQYEEKGLQARNIYSTLEKEKLKFRLQSSSMTVVPRHQKYWQVH